MGERGGPARYLKMGKEAQVCRDFVRRRTERRQRCEDVNIDLTRIRL